MYRILSLSLFFYPLVIQSWAQDKPAHHIIYTCKDNTLHVHTMHGFSGIYRYMKQLFPLLGDAREKAGRRNRIRYLRAPLPLTVVILSLRYAVAVGRAIAATALLLLFLLLRFPLLLLYPTLPLLVLHSIPPTNLPSLQRSDFLSTSPLPLNSSFFFFGTRIPLSPRTVLRLPGRMRCSGCLRTSFDWHLSPTSIQRRCADSPVLCGLKT